MTKLLIQTTAYSDPNAFIQLGNKEKNNKQLQSARMDPAKEAAAPEHPTEDKRSDQREDLPAATTVMIAQGSGDPANLKDTASVVGYRNPSLGGQPISQDPQSSLNWSQLSTSDMAFMHHDGALGGLVDPMMERPKTPIRQYLIDVIGEKNVCELEAVDDKDDETDDEFRQACAEMIETDIDFNKSNVLFNNETNNVSLGQPFLGQAVGEKKVPEKKQSSTAKIGDVGTIAIANDGSARNGSKHMGDTAKEEKAKGKASSPIKRRTGTNGPKSAKRGEKMSHQDRLRLGVERIKQSSTYWKEEEVQDPRMAGWCIHICKRATGHMDKYWFTSTGIKLRSKPQVEKFLNALQDTNGDEDLAYGIVSGSKKRRSLGNESAPKATNTDSSTKETSVNAESSSNKQQRKKKRASDATSQDKTAKAPSSTSHNANTSPKPPSSKNTVTTPRSSSRKRNTATATMLSEDGIDYSMTSAVQSVSASKRRYVKKKERVTKHISVAKDAKRVRSATVAGVLQQKSNYITDIVAEEVQDTRGKGTSQSIVFERIQRMKESNSGVPYRLTFQNANITDQFAEPKYIDVKKATKKKAAKGMQAFSPVSKLDIPAVAESK